MYLQVSAGAPSREPDETPAGYRERLIALMRSGEVLVSKSWIFRSAVGGRETRVGLGAYPGVTLAKARERAKEHRDARDRGVNPLEAKRQKELADEKAKQEKATADALAAARGTTFAMAAEQYIAGQEAGWSNAPPTERNGVSPWRITPIRSSAACRSPTSRPSWCSRCSNRIGKPKPRR